MILANQCSDSSNQTNDSKLYKEAISTILDRRPASLSNLENWQKNAVFTMENDILDSLEDLG